MDYSGLLALALLGGIGVWAIKDKIKLLHISLKHLLNSKNDDIFIDKENGSALINYNFKGLRKRIIVPYKQNLFRKMNQSDVFLVKDDKTIEITQQPGIPYLINAKMLGGTKLLVKNKINDIENQYEENEFINFDK